MLGVAEMIVISDDDGDEKVETMPNNVQTMQPMVLEYDMQSLVVVDNTPDSCADHAYMMDSFADIPASRYSFDEY